MGTCYANDVAGAAANLSDALGVQVVHREKMSENLSLRGLPHVDR